MTKSCSSCAERHGRKFSEQKLENEMESVHLFLLVEQVEGTGRRALDYRGPRTIVDIVSASVQVRQRRASLPGSAHHS